MPFIPGIFHPKINTRWYANSRAASKRPFFVYANITQRIEIDPAVVRLLKNVRSSRSDRRARTTHRDGVPSPESARRCAPARDVQRRGRCEAHRAQDTADDTIRRETPRNRGSFLVLPWRSPTCRGFASAQRRTRIARGRPIVLAICDHPAFRAPGESPTTLFRSLIFSMKE